MDHEQDGGEHAALLRYAELTYRAVTEQRRRQAAVALGVAAVFGLMAVWSALQWQSTRSTIADVQDASMVDVMGLQVPDPRPMIERGELRLRAFVWGAAAAATAVLALLALGVYAVVRPAPAPAPGELREAVAGPAPPVDP